MPTSGQTEFNQLEEAMGENVDIAGLNKAEVLAALYNNARSQGLGFLHREAKDMTKEEAQSILDTGETYFDYLKGRVMKVSLKEDSFVPYLYDRDNGTGAAASVIDALRAKQGTSATA